MPKFYSKSWEAQFRERDEPVVPLLAEQESSYDYILFIGDDRLEERINQYKPFYPNMKLEKKCQPSTIDRVLHKLNPRNSNEYIEVWKTNK